jgi:hypothetical protein
MPNKALIGIIMAAATIGGAWWLYREVQRRRAQEPKSAPRTVTVPVPAVGAGKKR